MQTDTTSKYVDPGAAALKWALYIIFALCVAVSLTGCNTVAGAAKMVGGLGKDIEAAARGTQAWLAKDADNGE